MTTPVSTYRAGPYTGNGVATSFAFDFKVFAKADLRIVLTVVATGVESDLVLDSDYTVTLNPDQNVDPGGTITYNPSGTPMASTHKLTIVSDLDIEQPLDITNLGGFFPQTQEDAFDRAVILIGQQQEALDRAGKLPVSVTGVSAELPVPVASTFLGWNSLGTAIINYAGVASAAVSAAMAAVVGAATLPLARAALGFSAFFDTLISSASSNALLTTLTATRSETGAVAVSVLAKIREVVSVTDFGAVGNGVADNTAAFQAAVNSVASGATIFICIPPGNWLLNTPVSNNGRVVSWIKSPAAELQGVGFLDAIGTPNFSTGTSNMIFGMVRGSASAPNTAAGGLMMLKKVSGATATTGRNSCGAFLIEKRGSTTTSGNRAEAIFGEAVDYTGGSGTFVEGGRFHGTVMTGATAGSGYGVIAFAGAETSVAWEYLVGLEGEVANKNTDAPTFGSFNKNSFAAGVVATSGLTGTQDADAGFVTNPFVPAGGLFRTGFLVAEDGVRTDGFANRAALVNGLNLSLGSYSGAAILLANNANGVVRAKNAANNADHNVFYYDNSNKVIIGTDAVSVKMLTVDDAIANPLMRDVVYGAADSGSRGAGFRALQVAN